MTDLATFLLARISEDETKARDAGGDEWASWNRSWDSSDMRDIASTGERLFTVPMPLDEHVARWDPARVLAECEAKRRIVGQHTPNPGPLWAGETLRYMAAIWANHPNYDPSWA